MEVIGIETLWSVALVRTHQRMLGFNCFGDLTLLGRDGQASRHDVEIPAMPVNRKTEANAS